MANILPVPESEQRVLDNLIRDLNETYPDKVIVRLQQDHKKWYEKVTRLYKNIGYASRDEFLNKQVFEFNAKNDNELVERASPYMNFTFYKGLTNWCGCGQIDMETNDFIAHLKEHHKGVVIKNSQLNQPKAGPSEV